MPNLDDKNRHLAMTFINQSVGASANVITNSVDLANYDPGYTFIVTTRVTGANGTATISVEEASDLGGTFNTVPADKIIGLIPSPIDATTYVVDNTLLTFGVVSVLRFVRLSITEVGTVNPIDITIVGNGFVEVEPPIIAEGVPILV